MMRTFPEIVWDEHDVVGIIPFINKVDMSDYAYDKWYSIAWHYLYQAKIEKRSRKWGKKFRTSNP